MSDADRQATLHIIACVTECLRLHNPAAGHVCDSLAALFAQRDLEAANRDSADRIVAFPDPPGLRALIEAMCKMEPPRYQREKADPLGWLIATAKLDQFPDHVLLRLAREYYSGSGHRERPKPIELRELCKKLVRDTPSLAARWHQ